MPDKLAIVAAWGYGYGYLIGRAINSIISADFQLVDHVRLEHIARAARSLKEAIKYSPVRAATHSRITAREVAKEYGLCLELAEALTYIREGSINSAIAVLSSLLTETAGSSHGR